MSVRLGLCAAALAVTPILAQSAADQTGRLPADRSPTGSVRDPAPTGFQPAQLGQQTDRSRFGEIPSYGNPSASGAGSTGYDSRNRRKARRRAGAASGAAPSSSGAVPSSTVLAQQVAADATLLPPPPPPATTPQMVRRGAPPTDQVAGVALTAVPVVAARKRPSDEDAFDPLGIRTGAFILKPAIELSGGYDSNPQRVPGGGGSSLTVVAPELLVRSDWERHALNADLKGSYTDYGHTFVPDLDRPTVDAKVDGRIDITSRNQVDLEGRFLLGTDNPGSPNLQAGLLKLPIFTTTGGTLGYTQRFNRLELSLKGTLDRTAYDDSRLTDGTSSSNGDRNFDQYGAALRGSYELTPGVKPFVEVGTDTRVHDLAFDRNGLQRDSDGNSIRAGSTFELSRKLTGEISGGYADRVYKDPRLPALRGPLAAASLNWTATALTTVKLSAQTTLAESTVAGVSGTFSRDYALEIDHAFRRWLIGTLRFGYGTDDYTGSSRVDDRYSVSAALVYKLSREIQLKAEIRRDLLRSSIFGVNYDANTVLVGLRLQR